MGVSPSPTALTAAATCVCGGQFTTALGTAPPPTIPPASSAGLMSFSSSHEEEGEQGRAPLRPIPLKNGVIRLAHSGCTWWRRVVGGEGRVVGGEGRVVGGEWRVVGGSG